jgi:hypothetical protein
VDDRPPAIEGSWTRSFCGIEMFKRLLSTFMAPLLIYRNKLPVVEDARKKHFTARPVAGGVDLIVDS